MKNWQHLIILMALSGVLLFWGLGSLGLTDRDEGLNAEAAREMVETGDYVSPTFNYQPRFQKPAMLYWWISGAYGLLGVHEYSARLPSALFGLFLVLLQYWFLNKIRGPTFAFWGSLILLVNPEMVAISRMVLTDSILIFFITLSLFSFWLGMRGKGKERHYFWLFYVGMALATLTKGPIGLGLPGLIVVLYLSLARRWGEFWKKGFPLGGALLYLLVATPWFITMWQTHGEAYLAQLQVDNIGRFLNPQEGHGFNIFFYFLVLLLGFFPWSLLLPFARFRALFNWRSHDFQLFAALWLVVVFVFFTISSTRLPHYIGPLFPAAAFLVADLLERLQRKDRFKNAVFPFFWSSIVIMSSCLIVFLNIIAPQLGQKHISPPQQIMQKARPLLKAGDKLIFYDLYRPSLIFYAQHKGHFFKTGQEKALGDLVAQSDKSFLLLPAGQRGNLPKEVQGFLEVLNENGYLLLAGNPQEALPSR